MQLLMVDVNTEIWFDGSSKKASPDYGLAFGVR